MTLERTSLFASAGSDAIPLILLGAVIVGVLLVFWLVPAVFLFSAKTAGVENRSYGKALLAIFLRIFVSLLIVLVFSLLPAIGTFFGILVAFLVNGAVIAGIFSTSYGKGLLTEILFMFFGVLISLGTAGIGLGVAGVGVSGTFHRIQQEIELGDFSWAPSRQSAEPRPEERPISREPLPPSAAAHPKLPMTSDSKLNEARVRMILADITLGGPLSYYRSHSDDLHASEAVRRWDRGIRPANPHNFARIRVNGAWTIVYAGTERACDGMDVRLTTD